MWEKGIEYILWYDCIFLVFSSVCILELCSRMKNRYSCVWKSLAKCSFGIYLVHNPIKILVQDYIEMLKVPLFVQVTLLFAFSFLVSWGVELVSRISKWAKFMFYIKD